MNYLALSFAAWIRPGQARKLAAIARANELPDDDGLPPGVAAWIADRSAGAPAVLRGG
jgi:hypothetical protein